jgi:hypothetical protein
MTCSGARFKTTSFVVSVPGSGVRLKSNGEWRIDSQCKSNLLRHV